MADPTPSGGKLTIQQEIDKLSKSCVTLKDTMNKVRDKLGPVLRRDAAGNG